MHTRLRYQRDAVRRIVRARRGVATVELAFCLPVLLLLVLGSIETCNVVFQKQTMTAAAYEAARIAIRQDATSAEAQSIAGQVMTARNINHYTVTFTPSDITNLARGTNININVSAPADQNTIMPSDGWYNGRTMQVSVRAVKE